MKFSLCPAVQVDLGFLVDGSSSVPEGLFRQLFQLVTFIYSAFPVSRDDTRVGLGLISASPLVVIGFEPFSDKPTLHSTIEALAYPGDQRDANLGAVLTVAKEKLFDSTSRKGVRQVSTACRDFTGVMNAALNICWSCVRVHCVHCISCKTHEILCTPGINYPDRRRTTR